MRKDTCKHFNGIQNDRCLAGVCYDSFPGPKINSLPCLRVDVVSCHLREYPTLQEIDQYETEVENAIGPIIAIDNALSDGEEKGIVQCHCGGEITWLLAVPGDTGSLRASCDKCNWRAMS